MNFVGAALMLDVTFYYLIMLTLTAELIRFHLLQVLRHLVPI